MSFLGEVETAYYTLIESGAPQVTILHCTSNYPASYQSVNLHAMLTIKDALKVNVGYSDHTEGNEISIAAVALGATVIEKHFTIDKNLPGPDHSASINPHELKNLVQQIRNVEAALSADGRKVPAGEEIETKRVVQKGIYCNKDLLTGSIITLEDLTFKRPLNDGLSASNYTFILGKILKADVGRNELITLNHL